MKEETLGRLAEAVEKMGGELQLLRTILDEIRDDFGWALSNDRLRPECQHTPMVLTSMPKESLGCGLRRTGE